MPGGNTDDRVAGAEHSAKIRTVSVATIFDFFQGLASDAVSAVKAWPRRRKILTSIAIILFLVITFTADIPSLGVLREYSRRLGPAFPLAFWCFYVLITQFPVPRTVLTLSAGILFGPVQGILLALSATTVSGAISLLIVRSLLGEWMAPRLTHPAVASINRRLRERGWLAVTSLRMIAGVPFSLLNYVAALTAVPVLSFTLATFIGSAPGTILVVVLGDTLTGEADPRMIVAMLLLALLGIAGLVLDTRLGVKSGE
nr:TVP38/TMEM64 family protein [Corynebacterium uropygiale]